MQTKVALWGHHTPELPDMAVTPISDAINGQLHGLTDLGLGSRYEKERVEERANIVSIKERVYPTFSSPSRAPQPLNEPRINSPRAL